MRKLTSQRVTIRGIRWDITVTDDVYNDNGESCFGICDYDNNKLLVRSDLPENVKWETLLHEILHAVTKPYPSDMSDEFTINCISSEIFSILAQLGVFGKGCNPYEAKNK